jgi:hypothetical protein
MATILPGSKNFLQTQESFLQQSLFEYSDYLNSMPLLVEYYSKDMFNSTYDVNLHTVQEILGNDSPVKFDKILNFPLYKISNFEFSSDDSEDVGTEGNIEGTAIVPPLAVVPKIDDLFIIPYHGKKNIFRVKSLKRSNKGSGSGKGSSSHEAKSMSFYEITFYLYSTLGQRGDINRQVKDEYQVVGSPSSAAKSSIITVDRADLVFNLQNKIDLLQNNMAYFYKPICESFIYEEDYTLWGLDECLNHFISNNGLLERATPYRNEIVLRYLDPVDVPDFYEAYEKSLFWALENQNYDLYDGKSSIFFTLPFSDYVPGTFLRTVKIKGIRYTSDPNVTTFHYKTVFGNIKDYINDSTDDIKPFINDVEEYFKLIKFFKTGTDITKIADFVNSIYSKNTIYDYYFLPIAIFIFSDFIKRIRTIYNFNN